jgi:hypothetical protein
MLALTGRARLWEPRRLRIRLLSAAAQLVTTARRQHLRFATHRPWTDVITDAMERLQAAPEPRLTSSDSPPLPEPARRSRGTRRPPDATAGPLACPHPAQQAERAHQMNWQAVTKDRG